MSSKKKKVFAGEDLSGISSAMSRYTIGSDDRKNLLFNGPRLCGYGSYNTHLKTANDLVFTQLPQH